MHLSCDSALPDLRWLKGGWLCMPPTVLETPEHLKIPIWLQPWKLKRIAPLPLSGVALVPAWENLARRCLLAVPNVPSGAVTSVSMKLTMTSTPWLRTLKSLLMLPRSLLLATKLMANQVRQTLFLTPNLLESLLIILIPSILCSSRWGVDGFPV